MHIINNSPHSCAVGGGNLPSSQFAKHTTTQRRRRSIKDDDTRVWLMHRTQNTIKYEKYRILLLWKYAHQHQSLHSVSPRGSFLTHLCQIGWDIPQRIGGRNQSKIRAEKTSLCQCKFTTWRCIFVTWHITWDDAVIGHTLNVAHKVFHVSQTSGDIQTTLKPEFSSDSGNEKTPEMSCKCYNRFKLSQTEMMSFVNQFIQSAKWSECTRVSSPAVILHVKHFSNKSCIF